MNAHSESVAPATSPVPVAIRAAFCSTLEAAVKACSSAGKVHAGAASAAREMLAQAKQAQVAPPAGKSWTLKRLVSAIAGDDMTGVPKLVRDTIAIDGAALKAARDAHKADPDGIGAKDAQILSNDRFRDALDAALRRAQPNENAKSDKDRALAHAKAIAKLLASDSTSDAIRSAIIGAMNAQGLDIVALATTIAAAA